MYEYLSADWVEAVDAAMEADTELVDLCNDADFTLQQVITDAPDGRLELVFRLGPGSTSASVGTAADADITFSQSYATAVAVYTGALNALDAFQDGRIELAGDSMVLHRHRPILLQLQRTLAAVRDAT